MHLLSYAPCIPFHPLLAVQERESQLVSARIVLMLPHQLVGRPSSRRSRAQVWTEHSIHLDVQEMPVSDLARQRSPVSQHLPE